MNIKRFKISALLIVSVLSIVFCGYTNVYDGSQSKVYDEALLFTEDEKDELQKMCVESAESTKLDVVVATIDDSEGKSSMVYADDFYDDMGFGYDQGASGLIMLIDMDNREIYISTAGIAIEYFNDNDIDNILTDMDDFMASADYFDAAVMFINDVNNHVKYINSKYYDDVKPWFDGNYYDYAEFEDDTNINNEHYNDYETFEDDTNVSILQYPLIDFIIAVFISLVIVTFMIAQRKSKMTVNSDTYMNKNSLEIHKSSDIYLRTSVSKTKIQSSSSHSGGSHHRSSGGGSHHRSSSGRSHGGGGHKF